MEAFWNSCTGSELLGYYSDKIIFKISVYTISKPTIYKIELYDLNGNKSEDLFQYLEETKEIVEEWCKGFPIQIKFIEHKIVDINGKLKIPQIKTNFINRILSPRTSPKSRTASPKNSPKSRTPSPKNSPKSRTPSPKNSPKSRTPSPVFLNKNRNYKVDSK